MNFPQSVTVEVTADDIAHGERMECERCPIALAVQRHLPGTRVSVLETFDTCRVGELGEMASYRLPTSAIDFVDVFDDRPGDRRSEPEPFTFTMELT